MPRKPSEKTQLATARRELRDQSEQLRRTKLDLITQRSRADRAEKEVEEWKARHDKLLEFRKVLGMPTAE